MICRICGARFGHGNQYCHRCGSAVESTDDRKTRPVPGKKRAVWIMAALVLTAAGVMVWMNTGGRPAARLLAKGETYLAEGAYRDAITFFRQAIDAGAKEAEAYIGLATAYQEIGEAKEAVGAFREGLANAQEKDCGIWTATLMDSAKGWIAQKEYGPALDTIALACDMDEGVISAFLLAVNDYGAGASPGEAVRLLCQAFFHFDNEQIQLRIMDAMIPLCRELVEAGEYGEVINALNDCVYSKLALDPQAYMLLADAYIGIGSIDPALRALDRGYAMTGSVEIAQQRDADGARTSGQALVNISANAINHGIAAREAEWIYYATPQALCKVRTNGTGMTKLYEGHCNSLAVSGDWVYFNDRTDNQYYRIRTDGTGLMKITDDHCSNVILDGDWLYYSNHSDMYSLYKIRIDGTGRTKLTDDWCFSMNLVDGRIVYVNGIDAYLLIPTVPRGPN